jgi:hypothetical protein
VKTYGEWRCSTTIIDLGIGGELSVSRPGRFISWERVPGMNWVGVCGWVPEQMWTPQNRDKSLVPAWNRTAFVKPVTVSTELWGLKRGTEVAEIV